MEQHSCEQQPSNEAKLCGNNCGFFGNPATLGLCSKCFRETQASSQKKPHEECPIQPAGVTPPADVNDGHAVAEIDTVDAISVVPEAEAAQVEALAEVAPQVPDKPTQANRSRCFNCSKKVGLLGFECRCGYVFCSSHRHAGDHSCTFDYAAFDRDRLAKANPMVAASKLDKL